MERKMKPLPPLNRSEIHININYLNDRHKTDIPKHIPKLNHCTFFVLDATEDYHIQNQYGKPYLMLVSAGVLP
jgi:hypothetical protein